MFFGCHIAVIFVLTVVQCELQNRSSDQCPNLKADLRSMRKRRHLTFPDGSAATITISLAKTFLTHVPSGWYMTMDLDALYPLPDSNFTIAHSRRKLHHRQKRELWERLKNTLYFHNIDGHACLLRSICEAKTHLAPVGKSLVHDILRVIFTAPLHEEDFAEETGGMYSELSDPHFCDKVSDCPFSLLHFVLEFNKRRY